MMWYTVHVCVCVSMCVHMQTDEASSVRLYLHTDTTIVLCMVRNRLF